LVETPNETENKLLKKINRKIRQKISTLLLIKNKKVETK